MHNFFYLINSLWSHFSNRRKKQFSYLLILMLIASFAEVLSLGAVLPFLAAIADPNYIYTHQYAQPLVQILGLTTANQIILPMSFIFISAVLFSGSVRVLLLYFMTRLSYAAGADISFEIYNRTLHQNYDIHISRNSSEIINSIIRKTDDVIGGIISPILLFISNIVLFFSILIALFSINVFAALVSSVGFGTLYWFIIIKSRQRLNFNSQCIADESTKVIQSLQEGLGGIRDVLLDGNQKFYCDMYRKSDLPLRYAQGNNSFITGSPRFVMEALGMILIAGLAYFLTLSDGGITTAMPILGALALGAQRMLPALQQAYGSISTIRGSQVSFEDVLKLINMSNRPLIIFPQGTRLPPEDRTAFKKGASRIYEELKISCQPIAINSGFTWPKYGPKKVNTTLIISILHEIEPGQNKETFLKNLQDTIYNELDTLN